MNLKKWKGKVITSKYVGTGPSSYDKRIYRAAVSQRLRNAVQSGRQAAGTDNKGRFWKWCKSDLRSILSFCTGHEVASSQSKLTSPQSLYDFAGGIRSVRTPIRAHIFSHHPVSPERRYDSADYSNYSNRNSRTCHLASSRTTFKSLPTDQTASEFYQKILRNACLHSNWESSSQMLLTTSWKHIYNIWADLTSSKLCC